jgi:hypothetical protein
VGTAVFSCSRNPRDEKVSLSRNLADSRDWRNLSGGRLDFAWVAVLRDV